MKTVIEKILKSLPLATTKESIRPFRIFSKQSEINQIEDLKQFDWISTRFEDEVCVEFVDRKEACQFYEFLREMKLITYKNFINPHEPGQEI